MNLVEYLIAKKAIRARVVASDWKEAVRAGVDILIAHGAAQQSYYDAIISGTEKNGPYFVLMPYVALPHARPERGALDQGYSLVTLKKAVNFGSDENDPIGILLSFAAKNSDTQLEGALAQAVTIFEDESVVHAIATARSRRRIEKILKKIDFSEVV